RWGPATPRMGKGRAETVLRARADPSRHPERKPGRVLLPAGRSDRRLPLDRGARGDRRPPVPGRAEPRAGLAPGTRAALSSGSARESLRRHSDHLRPRLGPDRLYSELSGLRLVPPAGLT